MRSRGGTGSEAIFVVRPLASSMTTATGCCPGSDALAVRREQRAVVVARRRTGSAACRCRPARRRGRVSAIGIGEPGQRATVGRPRRRMVVGARCMGDLARIAHGGTVTISPRVEGQREVRRRRRLAQPLHVSGNARTRLGEVGHADDVASQAAASGVEFMQPAGLFERCTACIGVGWVTGKSSKVVIRVEREAAS